MSAGEAATVIKVGLVGAGTIGQVIAAALDTDAAGSERARYPGIPGMTLVALADKDHAAAEALAARLACSPSVVSTKELIERVDLVVEAAGQAALLEVMPLALAHKKDLLILSVGGLLGHEDWFAQARERGCRIYVPSGAIGGLDALKSAARGRLDSVRLTSRKPAAALRGVKYVVEQKLDVDSFTEPTVIFEGRPEEACKAFPTTSNVAASLRLAAGGTANVCIRVMAMPGGMENVHEIEVEGEFGRLRVVTENVPSESNPRTSKLAALSAVATLEGITRSLRVGT